MHPATWHRPETKGTEHPTNQITCMNFEVRKAYHAAIQLHGDHLFSNLQQLHGQVAGSRADFQHHIRRLDARLGDDGVDNLRVLEDVLALGFVELQACSRRCTCSCATRSWR